MVDSNDPQPSWWRRHATTVTLLLVAAAISFILRVLWSYNLIDTCNIAYCYAGGSDSFYHSRVMTWIITNHNNLVRDPLLNYPVGAINPREPLFDWMNAIFGMLLAPFFGGNANLAGMWVLEMQPVIWAALGVFPVYFLGKEVSSTRMALIAALLYPLIVGNIQSTVATYANYLSFYAFFIVLTCALYVHAVKLCGTRRWVENYRSPRSIWNGFKRFVTVERNAVNWAFFAGVSLGVTTLAWQGYTYCIAIIVVFLVLIMLIERLRKVDSFGVYVTTFIVGAVGFPIGMPYYFGQQEFGYWFTVPLLLFFGALLIMLPFLLMRDYPWVVSIPILIASVVAGAAALYFYSPSDFNAVLTGQGYFVKNLIYSTVAEAQAPSFDALVVSYGIVTFFLAFFGLALFVAYLYIHRFRREHLFMVLFGVLGIYLPISAAKFFLIGSPVFALLPAEFLLVLLDRTGYPQLRRNLASLSQGAGVWTAIRRSIKIRHAILIIVVMAVILPNVWYAMDASIPYNNKVQYNEQIYNTLPPFLQTSPANASTEYYLGAGGIDTDTPQQYDEGGYNWLATQDTNLPAQDRPAFMSWWDYGFQAIDEGQHPSVAENFQDGIDPSGAFLLSQNESDAIAVLTVDLLAACQHVTCGASGAPANAYLPAALNAQLAADGLNISILHSDMVNLSTDISEVIAHPGLYGTVNAANLDGENAMYKITSVYIGSALSENGVVNVYQTVQDFTGWSIKYAMVDSRVFPVSGSSTGIFYAPVDLTDGVIGSSGIPTEYFNVTVTGTDGNTYSLNDVPAGVGIASESISYNPAFYNSMIYHIYVGYNGSEIGDGACGSNCVPYLSSALSSNTVEPAWMEQHFVLGYQTAYWCPQSNPSATSSCSQAVNLNTAEYYQKASIGTSDTSMSSYFNAGESILEYYKGQTVTGQVLLPNGAPAAGIRLTILDHWGIPHMTTVTGSDGSYSLIAPPGNDSLVASYGAISSTTGLTQEGSTLLKTINFTVSEAQADGVGGYPMDIPVDLSPASVSGVVYWNNANSTTYSAATDTVIPGAAVTISNGINIDRTATTDASGTYQFTNLPPNTYNLTLKVGSSTLSEGTVTLTSGQADTTQNIGLKLGGIVGKVTFASGANVTAATVTLSAPSTPTLSTTTGTGGNYSFAQLSPGNYTLVASTSSGASSPPTHVELATLGTNATANLTLSYPVSLSFPVTYNGEPVPNLPVRLAPLDSSSNQTYVFTSNATGWLNARVTAGNWSVYALGAQNGTLISGLSNANLASGVSVSDGSPLVLAPAYALEGTAGLQGTAGTTSGIDLAVQAQDGALLLGSTNASGDFHLFLPEGTYAVLATYTSGGPTATDAAFGSVFVGPTPTPLNLRLASSLQYSTEVGYHTYQGAFVPLPGAVVNFTQVSTSSTFHLVATSNGTATLTVPSSVSGSYEVTASDPGFITTTVGPEDLSELITDTSKIVLPLKPIPLTVLSTGLPPTLASQPVINFTGETTAATNATGTGRSVTVDLTPGTYGITGWARPATGTGTLHPVANLTVTLPYGGSATTVTLPWAVEHTFAGNLSYQYSPKVNASIPLSTAHVTLNGPTNLTLTGATYATDFNARVGNYTAYVTGMVNDTPYAFFGNVSLNASGKPYPANLTLTPASNVTIAMHSGDNTPLDVAVPFTLVGGASGVTPLNFTTTTSGNLTLVLPENSVFKVEVNRTLLLTVGGVLRYETYVTNATNGTAVCGVPEGLPNPFCTIYLRGTQAVTTLDASLQLGGNVITGGGYVWVDPIQTNVTEAPYKLDFNGPGLRLTLDPGTYELFTVLNPEATPEVNFTVVSLPYSATGIPLTLDLSPGWTQALTITPVPGLPNPGTVALNLTNVASGRTILLPDFAVGTTLLPLPTGAWRLVANASVAPYGPTVELGAALNLTVVSANRAVTLPLVANWQRTADLVPVGSGTATTAPGVPTTVDLLLTDTGNAPEPLTLTGSPSTWTFHFQPQNLSLGPAANNRSAVVEVTITPPTSVIVGHAPLVIQANTQGTTRLIATLTPALVVNIVPSYGLKLGQDTSLDTVGSTSVSLDFSIGDTGDSNENVTIEVADAAALRSDGWASHVQQEASTAPFPSPNELSAGETTSGFVVLNATSAGAIVPKNVTIYVSLREDPSLSQQLVIPVPTASLPLNGTVTVTGPNLGSPSAGYLPDLTIGLVVAPALAILAATLSWRWWKTRRWVRR